MAQKNQVGVELDQCHGERNQPFELSPEDLAMIAGGAGTLNYD